MSSNEHFTDQGGAVTETVARNASRFVSDLIAGLPDGTSFDAGAVLSEYPWLRQHKSAVLDLAYEEYCRAEEAGREIDANRFADRFSDYRYSLVRLLDVHGAIHGKGALLDHATVRWPQAGETFLDFQLLEELGKGAFSRVFDAIEPAANGRRVVVKVCQHGQYEVEAIAGLNHDNIVPLYSVKTDAESSLTGICMPFLGRTTLSDVLDHVFRGTTRPVEGSSIVEAVRHTNLLPQANGRYLPNRALQRLEQLSYVEAVAGIGVQLADALEYTHAKGICHGDIKPSNALLTDEGKAMLFDFNLAQFGDRKSRVGGTLPYMSSEQLRGSLAADSSVARLDARSDIFSLGAMLYQLLTGRLPFGDLPADALGRDALARELLARQRKGPEPIQKKNPHIDSRLARIVERCLAYEPAARYPSARALADALRSTQARSLRRWAEVNRRQVLFLGGGSLVACAALGGGLAAYLVTRQPLAEQGMAAFRAKDYERAVALLQQVPEKDSSDTTQLALARSYMHVGDFRNAYDALVPLYNKHLNEPEFFACRAQCSAQLADFRRLPIELEAARLSFLHAQSAGIDTPQIRNNIALCLIKLNREPEAKAILDRLDQDGVRIQAVYLNLAHIDNHKIGRSDSDPSEMMPNLRYIERALEIGPENRETHTYAATLYCCAARWSTNEERRLHFKRLAIEQIRKAVQLGAYRSSLSGLSTTLSSLNDDSEFQQLLQQAPAEKNWVPSARLADPFGGDDAPLMNLVDR